MSKNEAVKAKDPEVVAKPVAKLSLNEFCARLSTTDKRVELIGGFEHQERVAGRRSDTEESYSKRYTEFLNKPA